MAKNGHHDWHVGAGDGGVPVLGWDSQAASEVWVWYDWTVPLSGPGMQELN